MTNVPIVSGAMAWTDPTDSSTYILIFHESLYYGNKLDHSLINPNQVRHNGINFWDNPYDQTPGKELSIQIDRGPTIGLRMIGTKIRFASRVPTTHELSSCAHIHMTDMNQWNPDRVELGEVQRETLTTNTPMVLHISTIEMTTNPYTMEQREVYGYIDPTSDDAILHSIEPSLIQLQERAISMVEKHDHDDIPSQRSFTSKERHQKISSQRLAELWGIGPKRAADTIKATTQRSVRSAILPISRRYQADRMYRMKQLNGKFSTDTLYGDIKSL